MSCLSHIRNTPVGRADIIKLIFTGIGFSTLAGLVGWFINGWFWMWCVAIPALVLSTLFCIVVKCSFFFSAIDQMQQYPADERWLALSADAYDRLDNKEQRCLRHNCDTEGVGLLLVNPDGEVQQIGEARQRRLPKKLKGKSFLDYYTGKRVDSINAQLQKWREVTNGAYPAKTS